MSADWPYEEARKLPTTTDRPVVFETGYGPSGLPHIGTFTEVLRTSWVMNAYRALTGNSTRLISFSDDMDALRKVPDNVPNGDMLREHLGKSLTSIPDPFGCCESFAHHNNAQLREYLDSFGFEYEFLSSTECYRSGMFDETLLLILRNYDKVMDIILPTLRDERSATYCPFMPVLPDGTVLDKGYIRHDAEQGNITFELHGGEYTVPVTGGHCKLQWKVDWAMRWMALGVDYEMAGKDLTDSVTLSSAIVEALGFQPPQGFIYEMFLDANGKKISKSVGNGMSVDDWLKYGSGSSLSYYMYREPKKAKKLHVGLVAHATDDLWKSQRVYHDQSEDEQRGNPVHHVYDLWVGEVPPAPKLTYSNMVNLVKLLGPERRDVIESYLARVEPNISIHHLRSDLDGAVNYYVDHVASTVQRENYTPTDEERVILGDFADLLACAVFDTSDEAEFQTAAYSFGKQVGYEDRLRDWFKLIYQTILGLPDGPRIGLFIEVYGRDEFVKLLRGKLWLAENKEAVESSNAYFEEHGLPLAHLRQF